MWAPSFITVRQCLSLSQNVAVFARLTDLLASDFSEIYLPLPTVLTSQACIAMFAFYMNGGALKSVPYACRKTVLTHGTIFSALPNSFYMY